MSTTSHMAVGTEPLSYSPPSVTPVIEMDGAPLAGAAAVTFTLKVAGARLMVAPVVFEVWPREMVAHPVPTAVTVRVLASPQLPKVKAEGLTVATVASVLLAVTESVGFPLPPKSHPCLPSLFCSTTVSVVSPAAPTLSAITFATALTS